MDKFAFLLVVAALAAAPAFAEDAAAPATTAVPAAQGDGSATTSDLDKVVCKKMPPPIGSRIGAHTVCQTQQQWQAQMRDSQDFIRDQQQKGLSGGSPGG
jgi:hypothetical protein